VISFPEQRATGNNRGSRNRDQQADHDKWDDQKSVAGAACPPKAESAGKANAPIVKLMTIRITGPTTMNAIAVTNLIR
jgi:hypothetical protein